MGQYLLKSGICGRSVNGLITGMRRGVLDCRNVLMGDIVVLACTAYIARFFRVEPPTPVPSWNSTREKTLGKKRGEVIAY